MRSQSGISSLIKLLFKQKLFDENRDGYGNILILKDASIISKSSIIPDLLKGDIVENNNIEYIKVCNIKISSDVELESDVDGDKSDKLPVDIKILGNHIEVFSGMKEQSVNIDNQTLVLLINPRKGIYDKGNTNESSRSFLQLTNSQKFKND